MRWLTLPSWPSMRLAHTLGSTSTERPARAAASGAGTPLFSQSDTTTCRSSYVRSRYPSPVTASPTWPFRAHYAGRSTYVTRRGQRRAAIVPAEAIERAEDAADVAAAREALARMDAGDTRSP